MQSVAEARATTIAVSWSVAVLESNGPDARLLTGDALWASATRRAGARRFVLPSPVGSSRSRGDPVSGLRTRLPLRFDPAKWECAVEVVGPFADVVFRQPGFHLALSLEHTLLLRRDLIITVQLLPTPARVIHV